MTEPIGIPAGPAVLEASMPEDPAVLVLPT
jgi:hypothetical protein